VNNINYITQGIFYLPDVLFCINSIMFRLLYCNISTMKIVCIVCILMIPELKCRINQYKMDRCNIAQYYL